MKLRRLPTYNGWTIDQRCRQFRRLHADGWIDFVDFDTDEGQRLLRQMIDAKVSFEPVEVELGDEPQGDA